MAEVFIKNEHQFDAHFLFECEFSYCTTIVLAAFPLLVMTSKK